MQRITRDYYEQLCANKIGNGKEMDRYLKSTLSQDWARKKQNMNTSITTAEFESVIWKLPTKIQDQMTSQVNSIEYLETK